MSSKAWRTVLLPEPERPVRMTSWPGRGLDAAVALAEGRLVPDTALMRAGDAHVFAILGDGASSNVDSVVVELLGDLLVGQRFGGVFLFNHLLNEALEGQQGHSATLGTIHGFAEEGAQLEDSLRRVRVFAGNGSADG